jgi:rRNA maturation RNase YbeY
MRKLVISLDEKFLKEADQVKKILNKLDKLLSLKKKYVEVYLLKDDFNVHSFEAPKDFPRPDIKPYESLGEIYLCPDYIKKKKQDLALMLVHGMLHLLGYDHKKKGDRIKMEKKEEELLNELKK